MRPRPMNPHTACTLCEPEKHRPEVCLAVRGASRLKGEAIADTARISSGSFECVLWIYVDGQEDQVMPLVWLPGSPQFGSSRTEVVAAITHRRAGAVLRGKRSPLKLRLTPWPMETIV